MKIGNPPGAQFEILVDGKPRCCRDIKAVAIETAEFLRSKNPHSDIAVRIFELARSPGSIWAAVSARRERAAHLALQRLRCHFP